MTNKTRNMNLLIKKGEGLTVEFKERYTPKIDRDIVAFANSKGGCRINRMRTLMIEAGLKEPVFEMDSFFSAIFYRDLRYSLKAESVEGSQKTTQKTTQKILEAISKKSDITQKELAAVIGITQDGVKYHIDRLKKKGTLKRIGPDKGGYWEIVNG